MPFHLIGNAFLVLFALDGCLSLTDDVLSLQDVTALRGFRNALALGVLFYGVLIALLVPATIHLPLRVFGPPLAMMVWWSLGAVPLGLWIEEPLALRLTLASAQLAGALAAFAIVRTTLPGGRWLLAAAPPGDWGFRTGRAFAIAASFGFGVALLALSSALLNGVAALESWTGDFIDIDGEGIHMVDRVYEKDGHQIRLIGMMHIGNEDAYERIFESFAAEGTLVLEEGISDEQDVLTDRAPYDAFSEPLGLARQDDAAAYLEEDVEWPKLRRSDVDASTFRPETLAYLAGLAEASEALRDRDFDRVLAILRRPEMQAPKVAILLEDVVTRRDEHILRALEEARAEYPIVVVPWGALHQRALSRQVASWGYAQRSEQRHLALSWSELADRLSQPPPD